MLSNEDYRYFFNLYFFNILKILLISIIIFIMAYFLRKRLVYIKEKIELYSTKIFFFVCFTYLVTFSFLSILKHFAFNTHAADLGIYTQVIYNTSVGNFFYSSLDNCIYLGKHMILSTLFLVPFYKIYPRVELLLFLQTLLIIIGSLPIYYLANKILKDRVGALVLSLCYFLYPPLHYINLYDFHPDIIVIPAFLFAFYFLENRNYKLGYLFLLIAILTKEQMALIGFMFALYLIFFHKKNLAGILLGVFCYLYFYICIFIIPYYLLGSEYPYFKAYNYLGVTFLDKIKTVLFQPLFVLKNMFTLIKIGYLIMLFLPLHFLSLLSLKVLLLAAPTFLINLLADKEYIHYYSIFFQYNSSIIPFLFLSSIYGLYKIKNLLQKRELLFATYCMLFTTSFLVSYYFSCAPYSKVFLNPNYKVAKFQTLDYSYKVYKLTNHTKILNEAVRLIPKDAAVSAQQNIVPHLINRKYIYQYPDVPKIVEYVIIDKKGNIWPIENYEDFEKEVKKLDKDFEVIFNKDSVMIYRRK